MLNKKTYIRLLALVMALMMTVAVFAGCNNQEAIDEANANAQNAQNAADEAKKQAESLAQAAKDLADQLSAAQDKINQQDQAIKDAQAEASKAQDAANNAQQAVTSWHDPANTTKAPETTASIAKDPYVDATNNANLKAFTDLKNEYLILKRNWYTSVNYAALNKIFEDAAFEIYRTVDGTGLDQIVAEATTAAANVPSIVSEAKAVQDKIDAFAPVESKVYTYTESLVIAAREAFDAWVNDYAVCFFTNTGYTFACDTKGNIVTSRDPKAEVVKGNVITTVENYGDIIDARIVNHATKHTNDAFKIETNNLLYAEAKLRNLYDDAEKAIKDAMAVDVVLRSNGAKTKAEAMAIVNVLYKDGATQVELNQALQDYEFVDSYIKKFGITYELCKKNGNIINEAYDLYKIFYNANDGHDEPMAGAAGKDLLTGREFVELYVKVLYVGQYAEYQNTIKDYLYNKIVPFFLNTNNKSVIDDETVVADTLGWNDYLAIPVSYTADSYDANGNKLVVVNTAVYTLGVNKDHIAVYDAAGNPTGAKIPADLAIIEREFNRIAAKYAEKILADDYWEDFKVNAVSLEEAYVAADKYIVQAVAELAQKYYDLVVFEFIESELKGALEKFEKYNYSTGISNRKDAYYRAYDNAFYANVAKAFDLAIKAAYEFDVATYEALNTIADEKKGIENIEDQKMFTVTNDTQGCFSGIALYVGDGDAKNNNSAMETVLKAFASSMADVTKDIFVRYDDIKDAEAFHELKVSVAEKLDAITGIYELDSAKVKTENVKSLLIDNYGSNVATVLGKKLADIQANIYTTISTPRNTARDAIMAVEYMNYDDATVLFAAEKYQANKTDNKESKPAYYNSKLEVNVTAKDNKALNIVADRDVVAAEALYNLFVNGAEEVLKAFTGIVRANIQSEVNTAIELYKTKYDFGGLDHVDQQGVYLEADMDKYTAYLQKLALFETLGTKFNLANFSLLRDNAEVGTLADLETLGYVKQELVDADGKVVDYLFHITKFDASVAEITGVGASTDKSWYDQLAKNELNKYFALTSAKAYAGLEDARELAYLKDNVINGVTVTGGIESMPLVKAKFMAAFDNKGVLVAAPTATLGYYDANGNWVAEAVCDYEFNTLRTKQYLSEFEKTYTAICNKIAAINIIDLVDANKTTLEDGLVYAKNEIAKIVKQAEVSKVQIAGKDTPETTDDVYGYAYNKTDDESLAMVYVRYYLVGQYEWIKYHNNTK